MKFNAQSGISTVQQLIPGLTAGSVLFVISGGGIGQDNATLFWDNTNKRLSINTNTSPNNAALTVFGDVQIGSGDTNTVFVGKVRDNGGGLTLIAQGVNTFAIGPTTAGTVRILSTLTVATLGPAALGSLAVVTDGDAGLAWGATVVNSGAGATKYLVWANGTNWTVYGK